jgi:hypothetical protein
MENIPAFQGGNGYQTNSLTSDIFLPLPRTACKKLKLSLYRPGEALKVPGY